MITSEQIETNVTDNVRGENTAAKLRALFHSIRESLEAMDFTAVESRLDALETSVTSIVETQGTQGTAITALQNAMPSYSVFGSFDVYDGSSFDVTHTLNTTQVIAQFAVNGNVNYPGVSVKIIDFETIRIVNGSGGDVAGLLRVIAFD